MDNGDSTDGKIAKEAGSGNELQDPQSLYRLPNWFLDTNIQTCLDLQDLSLEDPLCTCEDCRLCRPSIESALAGNTLPCTTAPDERLSHETSSELLDALGAAFACGRYGGTSFYNPCLLLGLSAKQEIMRVDLASSVVLQLAKIMSIPVVSLDMEDWKELCFDFDDQNIRLLGLHRRSTPPEQSHPKPVEMVKRLAAIVEGPKTKLTAQFKSAPSNGNVDNQPIPTILMHLRDNAIKSESTFASKRQINVWQEILTGFRDLFQNKQLDNQRIVLIISSGDLMTSQQLLQKLKIIPAATITLPELTQSKSKLQSNVVALQAKLNWRRLRRFLRPIAMQQDVADFAPLAHIADLEQSDIPCSDQSETLGSFVWTRDQVTRTAAQIAGRAWRKNGITLEDLQIILRRLSLLTPIKTENPQETIIGGTVLEGQDRRESWRRRVEESCDYHEKDLLNGLVDRGTSDFLHPASV